MKAIREARDARAERGNSGASGSGPGPTQAGPSRFPAPRAPIPRAPAAPTSTYRRNKDADVISQIEDMPCKMTVGQMFRIAPGPRHEFIQCLQGIHNPSRPDRAQQAAPAEPRASRPILALLALLHVSCYRALVMCQALHLPVQSISTLSAVGHRHLDRWLLSTLYC